jgi:hypothetical protein
MPSMKKEESGLLKWAKKELKILENNAASDKDKTALKLQRLVTKQTLDLLRVFSEQGHSGFTASYIRNLFNKLSNYKPITALTGEDSEWTDTMKYGSKSTYFQNNRCSAVFKNSEGKTYWIDGYIFHDFSNIEQTEYSSGFTNFASSIFIKSFPWVVPDTPTYLYMKKGVTEELLDIYSTAIKTCNESSKEYDYWYNQYMDCWSEKQFVEYSPFLTYTKAGYKELLASQKELYERQTGLTL